MIDAPGWAFFFIYLAVARRNMTGWIGVRPLGVQRSI
jgi:hypothetical protein